MLLDYHSAFKKKGTLPFVPGKMDLKDMILSDIRQILNESSYIRYPNSQTEESRVKSWLTRVEGS
jgi:hypothetical protein